MWLWIRALVYMCVVGGGWLVLLPASILYWEQAVSWPLARPWPLVAAGVSLFGFGVLLALWAGYYLIQYGGGTPLPLDPPHRLVTNGPYRFVRNPQGIAMVLMVSGEVLVVESAWLWLLLPLTVAYLEVLVGPLETKQLARNFGSDYERYATQVRKWIPRL